MVFIWCLKLVFPICLTMLCTPIPIVFFSCFLTWGSHSHFIGVRYTTRGPIVRNVVCFSSFLPLSPYNNNPPYISRNWPKCNHYIANYMRLLVICNYFLCCSYLRLIWCSSFHVNNIYFNFHLRRKTYVPLVANVTNLPYEYTKVYFMNSKEYNWVH
jgi:hypothetical protein